MNATQGAMTFAQLRDEISWSNLLMLVTSAPTYKELSEANDKDKNKKNEPVLPELSSDDLAALLSKRN